MTEKKDVEKHAVAGSRKMLKERLKTFEGELWIRYDDHRRECDEERRLGEARYKQELKRVNDAEIGRKESDPRPSWRCMNPECSNEPIQEGECWLCPDCVKKLREKGSEQSTEAAELRRKLHIYYDDRLRETNLRKKAEKDIEQLNAKLDEACEHIDRRTIAVCSAVEEATRSAPMGFEEAISLIKRLGEIRSGGSWKDVPQGKLYMLGKMSALLDKHDQDTLPKNSLDTVKRQEVDTETGEDPFEPLDQTARYHRMLPAYAAKAGWSGDTVLGLMNEFNSIETERRMAVGRLEEIDAILHPGDYEEDGAD